ncbi:hypothetical protein [Cellulosimicrobium sp. 22601]|uniref:hypothetical protein n=1 Tax=unclassified Cellulosimicrobium TaxID=2624466 RepID=UPI003F879E31
MNEEQRSPTVPPVVRTVAYVVGLTFGLGVAPSLIALNLPAWAAVAGAISGAANALAFGYRPTRGDG